MHTDWLRPLVRALFRGSVDSDGAASGFTDANSSCRAAKMMLELGNRMPRITCAKVAAGALAVCAPGRAAGGAPEDFVNSL